MMEIRSEYKQWTGMKYKGNKILLRIINAHSDKDINSCYEKYPEAFSDHIPSERVPLHILVKGCMSYLNNYLSKSKCKNNKEKIEVALNYQVPTTKPKPDSVVAIENTFGEYGLSVIICTKEDIANWHRELKDVFKVYKNDFNILEGDKGGYVCYVPKGSAITYLLLYKDPKWIVLIDLHWVIIRER